MAITMQDVAGVLSGAGGLYELFGQGPYTVQGSAEQAATAADPFGSQRGQYQGMLRDLVTNPNSFMLSPAAKAQMDIGLTNVGRQGAAAGFLNSGNLLGGMQKYAQNLASQDYWKQLEALAGLSGANIGSPATAGQLRSGMFDRANRATGSIGAGLGGIGNVLNQVPSMVGGIGSLWNSIANSDIFGNASSDIGSLFGSDYSELDFNVDDLDPLEFDVEDFGDFSY